MLRALGRRDEALDNFATLFRDPKWSVKAQLRAAEIYLDKSDAANARRLLDKIQPTIAEKKERHFLRGRLELASQDPTGPLRLQFDFEATGGCNARDVDGCPFRIGGHASAAEHAGTRRRLRLKILSNIILTMSILPASSPSWTNFTARNESLRGPNSIDGRRDPAEPRRAFAQWYLARFDLRNGRRDRALESFAALQKNHPLNPALTPAFIEFAQFELEDRRFDEALTILDDARMLRPEPAMLDRVNLLAAEVKYRARRFDVATADFEQIARSGSALAPVAMFNSALGSLQQGDRTEVRRQRRRVWQKDER